MACRYFHARLSLVARGFNIEELKQIFSSCLPFFLTIGEDYERNLARQYFEEQHDWVEDRLVERLRAYATDWLETPGGSLYKEQYLRFK